MHCRVSLLYSFVVVVALSTLMPLYVSSSSSDAFIMAPELQQLLPANNVKIIDATFTGNGSLQNWKKYQNYYGNFDLLMQKFEEPEYKAKHIPGAIPLSLEVISYPGQFSRYELYPPNIFEHLLRKVGINNNDRIIVYGRGPYGGMLFAAKTWWILKCYGIKNVQVLTGGFDAWEKAGYPVTNEQTVVSNGNITTITNPDFLITFDELEARNNSGVALIDHLETMNVYDARPYEQYSGQTPASYASTGVLRGSHIKGARSLPLTKAVNITGELMPTDSLLNSLNRTGYMPGKPVIIYCNTGCQASLLLLSLYNASISNLKIYPGGMTEMALRDPERIA